MCDFILKKVHRNVLETQKLKNQILWAVDPKNWNLFYFDSFYLISYAPGPKESLLYPLASLNKAFWSLLVSNTILSKKDRILSDLKAGYSYEMDLFFIFGYFLTNSSA